MCIRDRAPTVVQSASSSYARKPILTSAEQARQSEPTPERVTHVQKVTHVYPADYANYFWELHEIDLDGGLTANVGVNQFDGENLDSVSVMYSGNLEERANVLLGRHAGAEHRQLHTYSDVGQPITLEICTDPASDP
eukprot:8163406-Karenia_brevis.AAC.1